MLSGSRFLNYRLLPYIVVALFLFAAGSAHSVMIVGRYDVGHPELYFDLFDNANQAGFIFNSTSENITTRGNFTIYGNLSIFYPLLVDSNLTVTGTLTVNNTSTHNANVTYNANAIFNENLSIQGNLSLRRYVQDTPPDLQTNTSALWFNNTGNWYYFISDYDGTEYYLNMSTIY